ncbi:MAG: HK97 gp10 family phage protein [Phycisphaerales bacterium]|nr:HK97 gp10 family phage protein [Phycisphaerales bacterium]
MAEIVRIEGLTELKRKFESLPRDIAKKAFRRSLSAAAKQARDDARNRAPLGKGSKRRGGRLVPAGTLKRSALVKFDRTQSNDLQAVYIVTFRRGKKQQKGNRDAYYASWVEFGHRIVPRKPKGSRWKRKRGLVSAFSLAGRRAAATGSVAGVRYLTNAFAAGRYKYLSIIETQMRANFEAAAR